MQFYTDIAEPNDCIDPLGIRTCCACQIFGRVALQKSLGPVP